MLVKELEFDNHKVGQILQQIINEKKLAFIGLSRDPKNFSRSVYNEFLKQGFEIFPVNPNPLTLENQKGFFTINDIEQDINSAYIITKPERTLEIVKACHKKGISKIWMHRGEGMGSVSREALDYCLENGIDVVPGACPFMILEGTMFLHKIHGWWLKRKNQLPILPN